MALVEQQRGAYTYRFPGGVKLRGVQRILECNRPPELHDTAVLTQTDRHLKFQENDERWILPE
jgi:hypothetical protein